METPDHYLGGKVRKVQLENGVYAWAFSSSQYVQTAVKNVEAYLDSQENKRWKMPSKADTLLTTTYRPELDVSRELNEVDAAYYQSLIGILRWMVELGRVDVCVGSVHDVITPCITQRRSFGASFAYFCLPEEIS